MSVIKIDHLFKTFENGVTALSDVSLSVEEGDIFGIIGLSGAGKSTLVRCINLLERPSEGTVMLDGVELTALPESELRRQRGRIGMIFQSFNLMMQRTAKANVMYPMLIRGASKQEAAARAGELLQRVGLSDRMNAYPAQLSGGQKQRVAIARALAMEPRVLLCDEATSALDPQTTLSILELLRELNRELHITVIIITHEMHVIEQICNRVAIIENSTIREEGTVGEVFLNPKTEAAKALIYPDGAPDLGRGRRIRIVFDGTVNRPLISDMVLGCKAAVNIAFANTKVIAGKQYGQMIINLPEDPGAEKRMREFLKAEQINFEEA